MRRYATDPILDVIALFGADNDEDEDEKEDDSSSQDENESDESSDEDEKEDDEKTYSQDYVDKLRRENAKRRTDSKSTAGELAEAKAELAKRKKADMGELEAAQEEAAEAAKKAVENEARALTAEEGLRAERLGNAVWREASSQNFTDPSDALTMIPQDDLFDEDGELDEKAIEKQLKKLAKKKPYLLKTNTGGSGDGGAGGDAPDPKSQEARVAAHAKRFADQGRVPVQSS